MVEMTTYHVTATRRGRVWELRCAELPTMWSDAIRLDKAEGTVREAIAFVADVPQDSFDIEVIPVLPDEFDTEFAEAERLRAESALANTTAAEHARRAARVLAAQGLPLRDIGQIMGVSHQRAHQLVNA